MRNSKKLTFSCIRPNVLVNKCLVISLFSVILSCALFTATNGVEIKHNEATNLLQKVLTSFESMLAFFGDDYSSVNVDGLFGIRVGQGCINQTIKDCQQTGFECPKDLVKRLWSLNSNIEDIAAHAMPYVEEQDPEYFVHFRPTVDGPYILQYQTETIGDTWPKHVKDTIYDEKLGDMCLSSLMGMWGDRPKCTITDKCWTLMTKEETSGYTLTHQLLYFIIGDKTNCVSEIDARLRTTEGTTLRQHETNKCKEILREARREEKNGRVYPLHQDLFLEQGMLCGILGFLDFMTPRWVNMVLSWQNSEGCFAMPASLRKVESELNLLRPFKSKLFSRMRQEAYAIKHFQPTGRKLMREHFMKDGCLAHKTGLAFGLVGAYIRHFVRMSYAPEDFQH